VFVFSTLSLALRRPVAFASETSVLAAAEVNRRRSPLILLIIHIRAMSVVLGRPAFGFVDKPLLRRTGKRSAAFEYGTFLLTAAVVNRRVSIVILLIVHIRAVSVVLGLSAFGLVHKLLLRRTGKRSAMF
jgi:hypothetical protein